MHHFFIVPWVMWLHDAQILCLKLLFLAVCSTVNSNHSSTVCERTRFLSFTIHRNCQFNVTRWRKPESLSPVHHSDISRYSVQCCGIQNKFYLTIIYVWSAVLKHRILSPNYTLLFVACLGSVKMSRRSHRESPTCRSCAVSNGGGYVTCYRFCSAESAILALVKIPMLLSVHNPV